MTHHIDKAFGSGEGVEEKLWPELTNRVEYYLNTDKVGCKFHGRQDKTFVIMKDGSEGAVCSMCLQRLDVMSNRAVIETEEKAEGFRAW